MGIFGPLAPIDDVFVQFASLFGAAEQHQDAPLLGHQALRSMRGVQGTIDRGQRILHAIFAAARPLPWLPSPRFEMGSGVRSAGLWRGCDL